MPNSELGHLEIDGHDAETRAAVERRARTRTSPGRSGPCGCSATTDTSRTCSGRTSSWSAAACRKKADKFLPLLHLRAPIVAAQLRNAAGIVGAAWLAVDAARS